MSRPGLALPRFLVVALVVTTTFLAPPASAQSPPAHDPILIQGDADLCDQLDATGRIDPQDGISNCDTADGSAAAPYLVERFTIAVTGCLVTCTEPPPCSSSDVPAAVSICNTTKHILLRGLEIRNEEAVRSVQPGGGGGATSQVYAAGLHIAGASNVTVEGTNVFAAGFAVAIGPGIGPAARPVRNVIFRGGTLQGLTAEAGGQAETLVDIRRADVTMVGVTIDASGVRNAIVLNSQHGPNEARHEFSMQGSTVRDAALAGVDIDSYHGTFLDNSFLQNGVVPVGQGSAQPGYTQGTSGGTDLYLQSGDYAVVNNTFNVYGVGIQVQFVSGRITHNTFNSPNAQTGAAAPTALYATTSQESSVRVGYNDLNGLRVINEDTVHEINAAYNYWGDPAGPATDQKGGRGPVAVSPWLKMPHNDLPTVSVQSPAPGNAVHGRFLIAGEARPNKAPPLTRVEATLVEDSWVSNETATGIATWELAMDASGEPLGPFAVWIRACWNDGCGVPTSLDLVVVEQPLPPIAILEASPRVAKVGDEVLLDASLSYSPQARPIAAYRFDLGNGVQTAWVSQATYLVRYPNSGEYPVSVEVLDFAGLTSTNLPQIVLRIRGATDEGAVNPLPGPAPALLFGLLAAFIVLGRRRA